MLVASIGDPTAYGNETAYFVTYVDNDNIVYAQITTFEKLWLLQTVTKLEIR